MELSVQGIITKILQPETGVSKKGAAWTKQLFLLDTGEEYNNIICFEIFKDEKVQKFNQYNNIGDNVFVSFNVNCNEFNGKYYTSLQAWKVSKEAASNIEVNDTDEVGAPEPRGEEEGLF
jgi:hypothetical protein